MVLAFFIDHWINIVAWSAAVFMASFFILLHIKLREPQRYLLRLRFFQIRDELRYLVAIGVLREDSGLYRHYDKLINAILIHAEKWTLWGLVKAIKKYGKELKPEDERERKAILQALQKSDPLIRTQVAELYKEIAKLFVKQSRFVFTVSIIALYFTTLVKKLGSQKVAKPISRAADHASYRNEAQHLGLRLQSQPSAC